MIKAFFLALSLAVLSLCAHAQKVEQGPSGFQRLYSTGVSVGNGADLTEDTLATYTLPAGTLANAGDTIDIMASGSFGATTDSKAIRLRFGGGNLGGPAGAAATLTKWSFHARIVKTGASTQSYDLLGSTVNGNTGGTTSGVAAVTDTAGIVILIGGINTTNSVAGSVTIQTLTIDLNR
jgi:hypothetical protein